MSALSPILRDVEGNRLHFWRPGCDEVHGIVHGTGGWSWNGDVHKPTFSPSILVRTGHYMQGETPGNCYCDFAQRHPEAAIGCKWKCSRCHSFVTDGQIQFLGDCTHKLAGRTVPLPAWTDDDFSKEKTMTLKAQLEAALAAKNALIEKTKAEATEIEQHLATHGAELEVEAETFFTKLKAEATAGVERVEALIASIRAHL